MQYQVGQIVTGVVTGIQPYGAFVYIDEQHSGLIHISEISEDFVRDVRYFVKVGETLRLKVVDIDQVTGQLRLSLKALNSNHARKFKKYQRKDQLPEMVIGFRSLESHMDEWIAQKLEKMSKD